MDSLLSYVKENADLKNWLANYRLINGVNKLRKTLTDRIEAEDFADVGLPGGLVPYMGEVTRISETAKAVAAKYVTLEQLHEELREAEEEHARAVRAQNTKRKLLIVGAVIVFLALLYFMFK